MGNTPQAATETHEKQFSEVEFSLNELKFKDDSWEMTVVTVPHLPKVHVRYEAHFVPNPKQYDDNIKEYERRKLDVEVSDPDMPGEKQRKINELDQMIANTKAARTEFIEENEVIVSDMTVMKFENKGVKTKVTFGMLHQGFIDKIVPIVHKFDDVYKCELHPIGS